MTTTTVLVVSGITAAFLLFGAVLAWADFYTRGATRDLAATPQQMPAREHREAA
jgi:hypothetical protein